MVTIPADLLHALATPGGGQLALVIGAGCSIDAPTSIPLAGDLAEAVERQLVMDGVLIAGQCPSPRDLAALTSLIFGQTGSQAGVVQRFPLDRMRQAKPNIGYRLLVALMAERAITHVLSLNFDLAVQNAAAELGSEIAVIADAGQPVPVRPAIVHLHGNANSDCEALVLRNEVIDNGWCEKWEQIVAQQILGAPAVLFIGLGSPAPVLTATIGMIQAALAGGKVLYQADPGAFATNNFAQQLSIEDARFIQAGWTAVLEKLAERIAAKQVQELQINGQALMRENGYEQVDHDRFQALASRFAGLPLLSIGKLRAFADLDIQRLYRPHQNRDDELIVEPIVRLAQLAEQLGVDAAPNPSGTWTLSRDGRRVGQLVLASGGGVRRFAAVEPRARRIADHIAEYSPDGLDFVLLGGLADGGVGLAHTDIVADEDPSDIVGGPSGPLLVSANDADFIQRVGELLNAA